MKAYLVFGALALALSGCAAQVAVTPIGEDTYMIGRQGWISTQSVIQLKAAAFKTAGAYCASRGKTILPIHTRDTPGVLGRSYPETEIQFRCLNPGDPELRRPTLTKEPDVVIQQRP